MMSFRHLQGFSAATLTLMWIVRCAISPHWHWHTTMLVMIVLSAAASEVGYRAGLKARDEARTR